MCVKNGELEEKESQVILKSRSRLVAELESGADTLGVYLISYLFCRAFWETVKRTTEEIIDESSVTPKSGTKFA